MAHKLLIAGPGRSGTTLLVQILARLGFDTDVGRLEYFPDAHAGYESDVLAPTAPYVVKNPILSWKLGQLIEDGQISACEIDHVIIPIRELSHIAASRVRQTVFTNRQQPPGGLTVASSPKAQAGALAEGLYALTLTLAQHEIPFSFIAYPRFAQDPTYAWRALSSVLRDSSEGAFLDAWRAEVKPELIDEPDQLRVRRRDVFAWRLRMLRRTGNRRMRTIQISAQRAIATLPRFRHRSRNRSFVARPDDQSDQAETSYSGKR